jgi:hypothetical protein
MSLLAKEFTKPHSAPCREMLSASHAGMAHFATTGPEGKTCRECTHWQKTRTDKILNLPPRYARSGGALAPRSCKGFRALTKKRGGKVPHDTLACRYFVAGDHEPEAVIRRAVK